MHSFVNVKLWQVKILKEDEMDLKSIEGELLRKINNFLEFMQIKD